jgi:hypothetical protein
MARTPEVSTIHGRTAIIGVDVARFGDDQSVIFTRIGRDGASWPILRFRELDTMQLVSKVAEHAKKIKFAGMHVVIFVDGGGVGGGVVDRLRQIGYDVVEVQFGGKADDPRKYANKRAEMWARTKEWLEVGCLVKDEDMATDLTSVEYGFRPDDTILLESKESMKKRGLASPDAADALAVTFAYPVAEFRGGDEVPQNKHRSTDYDPYKVMPYP